MGFGDDGLASARVVGRKSESSKGESARAQGSRSGVGKSEAFLLILTRFVGK